MLCAKRRNNKANCIVFGLTRPGLEATIYRIRGKHANHYTIAAVHWCLMTLSEELTINHDHVFSVHGFHKLFIKIRNHIRSLCQYHLFQDVNTDTFSKYQSVFVFRGLTDGWLCIVIIGYV